MAYRQQVKVQSSRLAFSWLTRLCSHFCQNIIAALTCIILISLCLLYSFVQIKRPTLINFSINVYSIPTLNKFYFKEKQEFSKTTLFKLHIYIYMDVQVRNQEKKTLRTLDGVELSTTTPVRAFYLTNIFSFNLPYTFISKLGPNVCNNNSSLNPTDSYRSYDLFIVPRPT